MLFKTSLTQVFLLFAAHLLTQTLACGPLPDAQSHPRNADDGSHSDPGYPAYPYSDPGDDTPSDPLTKGYFINHLCINVRNTTESINWYNRAFGLRLMFTMHVSEHFSISYMGHSHGGRNGTGYQTADEINREKNNIEGLIELINIDAPSWNLPAGIDTPNTFSHIGMVVPDVAATQKHLESIGATIYKAWNETFVLDGPFADAAGLKNIPLDEISQDERDMIEKVLGPTNRPLIFVADPDGNIIEVQNQEGSALVQ
jgi:lactoylglutathione lyase